MGIFIFAGFFSGLFYNVLINNDLCKNAVLLFPLFVQSFSTPIPLFFAIFCPLFPPCGGVGLYAQMRSIPFVRVPLPAVKPGRSNHEHLLVPSASITVISHLSTVNSHLSTHTFCTTLHPTPYALHLFRTLHPYATIPTVITAYFYQWRQQNRSYRYRHHQLFWLPDAV